MVFIFLVDSLQLREIKLDKVHSWKPFYKVGQQRVLAPRLLLDKRSQDQRASSSRFNSMEMAKVGYEIYAEGPTRVLRICEISDSFKRDTVLDFCAKMHLRISQFAIHLLEPAKQVHICILFLLSQIIVCTSHFLPESSSPCIPEKLKNFLRSEFHGYL